ncbi:Phospholipase D-like domain [Trinorchestia longiramus]|nr:Phospholipase D-like domain [Trinorchestia longiramus]
MGLPFKSSRHSDFYRRRSSTTVWEWLANTCSFFYIVLTVMMLFTVFLLYFSMNCHFKLEEEPCSSTCNYRLVETIPENMTFSKDSVVHLSTYDAWSSLLEGAQDNVDMAVFYWSLTSEDVEPGSNFSSAKLGEDLLSKLMDVGLHRNVTTSITQNAPTPNSPQNNSEALRQAGAAQVVNLDMQKLTGGVLHTKMWVVDEDKLYLGSANMDFRSLTQVKELGVLLWNCSCLARDMRKIFQQYHYVGEHGSIPTSWPSNYSTKINHEHPLALTLNGSTATAFVSKVFVVPAYTPEQQQIPFARVNHNKYMVTDRVAYIGTSNWSGDYFMNTGGVGLIVNDTVHAGNASATTLRTQLQDIFTRDWNSQYARPVQDLVEPSH